MMARIDVKGLCSDGAGSHVEQHDTAAHIAGERLSLKTIIICIPDVLNLLKVLFAAWSNRLVYILIDCRAKNLTILTSQIQECPVKVICTLKLIIC